MAEIDEEITKEIKSLAGMAKRLGLKGTKAEQYIRQHMEQLGYTAKTHVTYERKQESGNKSGGFLSGLFSGSSDDDDDEL